MAALSAHDLQKKSSNNGKGPMTPKKYSNSCLEGGGVERIRVEDESEIDKLFQMGEVLGRGAFGVVKEATNRETKEKFAMKIVPKDKPGSVSIQLLEREVEVLKRVNHPSIIQVEAVYETGKKMYIVMELCLGGEVSNELKRRTYFKEEDAKAIMRRIVEAVVYMHDNDMVHRDLKLENILFATSEATDYSVKVTDFGLANMKGIPGCEDLMHARCGTPYYMAPEVLNTKHEYTKMCDVWSVGVIMYSLLCGRRPFESNNALKLEELIQKGELTFSEIEWINVSQTARDLLRKMLCVDTTSRYTARMILDDPWFTGERPKVKKMNALDLMRDMADAESSESKTSIVVSSPSGVLGTIPTTPSSPTAPLSPHTKVTASSSQSSNSSQKRSSNQGTPTKKVSGTHVRQTKPRTQSTSTLPSLPATSSKSSNPHSSSSNLQSSSGVTSPNHRHSMSSSNLAASSSGVRPRGSTYSSGSKSQVLSPPLPSSPKGSTESVQSSSSRERKLTSPSRSSSSRTKLRDKN